MNGSTSNYTSSGYGLAEYDILPAHSMLTALINVSKVVHFLKYSLDDLSVLKFILYMQK